MKSPFSNFPFVLFVSHVCLTVAIMCMCFILTTPAVFASERGTPITSPPPRITPPSPVQSNKNVLQQQNNITVPINLECVKATGDKPLSSVYKVKNSTNEIIPAGKIISWTIYGGYANYATQKLEEGTLNLNTNFRIGQEIKLQTSGGNNLLYGKSCQATVLTVLPTTRSNNTGR